MLLKYWTFYFEFKFLSENHNQESNNSHEWKMQKVNKVFSGTLSSKLWINREDCGICMTERQQSDVNSYQIFKSFPNTVSLNVNIHVSLWLGYTTFQLPQRLPGQSPVEPAPPSYTRSPPPPLYWLWREHPHGSPRAVETLII